ncbi:MAG: FlgD immunoglobulin-like domain containing protein [Candidatus Krumholzibacteria bacterium]|nr:FlgD immunoglobulin-like domain containing protein [Candidatus Krumholzibacteria bacterium]
MGKSPSFGDFEDTPDKSDTPLSANVFGLQQNVPNPFNPVTEIAFAVPDGGSNVSLRIYDVTGKLVRTLVDGYETAGPQSVSWFGKNDRGEPVASGTYFYQLSAPSFFEKKKMLLLK